MSEKIPEGWRSITLDQGVSILSGFPFNSSQFSIDPKHIGLVRIRDLVEQDVSTFYSGEYSKDFVVRRGNILIGMDGDFTISKWHAKNALLNQRVCKINVLEKSQFSEDYLYHVLREELLKINDRTGATTVKHLSVKDIKKIERTFPPLPEQQKIASILTSVDEVIEKTQSQINKLEDLKKATMNDLLTRGIGHTEFKDSELGRIPKSWGVSQNVDLCERIMVGVVITPAKFYVSIGVPVLRSANVKEGFITATDLKFFTNESNELMRKSILKVGDVLTVRTGYPGISAVVDKSFAGGNCVDLLISRPKSMICPDYLAYWINSDFGRGQVLRKQGGLAQQHFNVSELQALIVVLPPKEEQLKIVEILNSIDHQTKNISAKKINFINLKNSLMQDLLTGRVRVTVN